MGTGLKARLSSLLWYLQDPVLVARFQQLCGVRGAFAKSEAGINGGGGGERAERARQRVADPGGQAEKSRCNNNGVANGTGGPGDPVAVKPLRRNSLTGDSGHEFHIDNRLLYYLFTCGTELGNELFYISFFPFLVWNVDPLVARRLIIVWVWVMYVGQCTKDVMRWPRPASPPVVKVEVFYNSEYSMPSTHAMSGTAVPLATLLLTQDRWEYPFLLGVILAFSWCILVCTSRVYMGMHSVLDVIVGFFYSLLILLFFSPALEVVDTFHQINRYAPILIISLHAALGLFSFTLDTWSTSRGDTAQILGTGAGIAVATHVNYQLAVIVDPTASMLPLQLPSLSFGLVGLCLLRFVLGVLVILATRAVMKALTIPLVCWVVGISSKDVRKARQNMQVELPYRYIVYWTVGFSAFCVVPSLFVYIGFS